MNFSPEVSQMHDDVPGAAQLKASIERLLQARGIDQIENLEIAVSGRSVVLSGVIADRERKRRCMVEKRLANGLAIKPVRKKRRKKRDVEVTEFY